MNKNIRENGFYAQNIEPELDAQLDVFADGMYGEPEHMEVTMTDGTFDVILAMDSVDFAFFTDNN